MDLDLDSLDSVECDEGKGFLFVGICLAMDERVVVLSGMVLWGGDHGDDGGIIHPGKIIFKKPDMIKPSHKQTKGCQVSMVTGTRTVKPA